MLKNSILLIVLLFWPSLLLAQAINLTLKTDSKNHENFIFQSSYPVKYQAFSLTNSNRIVMDLQGITQFNNQIAAAYLVDSPIVKIRSSFKPGGSLRVVFELKQNSNIQYQINTRDNQINLSILSSTNRPIIVVIDPGHGGKDPGATGIHQIHEKDVVLNIAKKLAILLNQQPGFKAILTRQGDEYLTLRERLAIARQYKADMFIAIHADAYFNAQAQGVSIFALSQRGATSEAARWLANSENQSESLGEVALDDKENILRSILINLSQTATIQSSLLIGEELLNNMSLFATLHYHRIEQAAFVVLKSPDIPSLLVETGFLSNVKDERNLINPQYQQAIAQALMQGIRKYFWQHPPQGTAHAY